ncbi:redoxin domain-containing protein [Fusibacter sp. JL298sf-3]
MKRFLILLVALTAVLTACGTDETTSGLIDSQATSETEKVTEPAETAESTEPSDTEAAPEEIFTFEDLPMTLVDGTETSLYAYKDKTIVLNFWTTTCQFCAQTMPHLDALNAREDVVVLAVNVGEDAETAKAYLDENGYSMPAFIDPEGELAGTFGIRGFPTTFFISPDYELYLYQPGLLEQEALDGIMTAIEDYEANR